MTIQGRSNAGISAQQGAGEDTCQACTRSRYVQTYAPMFQAMHQTARCVTHLLLLQRRRRPPPSLRSSCSEVAARQRPRCPAAAASAAAAATARRLRLQLQFKLHTQLSTYRSIALAQSIRYPRNLTNPPRTSLRKAIIISNEKSGACAPGKHRPPTCTYHQEKRSRFEMPLTCRCACCLLPRHLALRRGVRRTLLNVV